MANTLNKVVSGGIKDGEVKTADIADQAVDLTKLPHGDGTSNGKFLRSNNGADPTWETVTSVDAAAVNSAGAVMNTDLDGKGEVLVGDGSGDPTALAVGTNDYVLTADSSEATGVKWAAAAGGVDGIASSADATGLTIDSSERFNYGYATNIAAFGKNARVQICGQDDDSSTLSIIRSSDSNDPARLVFGKSRGSNASPTAVNNAAGVGDIVWSAYDGNDWACDVVKIEGKIQPGAGIGQDDVAGNLGIFLAKDGDATVTDFWTFDNGGTIRMREGDSDNYTTIDGQATASVTAYQLKGSGTATFSSSQSNGNWTVFEVTGGSGKFEVRGHGHCLNTANSWGSTSDEKAKENIADAKSQWDDLKAIRVRNFNFKKEVSGESDVKMLGLVAQEAEKVCPSLVTNPTKEDGSANPDGYKTLKYSVLYMKAIKALQEAMARIETLETKVAALEAK